MARPAPFSFSSLDTFNNCPKQYYHKYVLRDVKEERSIQMIEGEDVHKVFENYINDPAANPLPEHLIHHQPKLDAMLARDGIFWCEERVGLDKRLQPCRWDDPDILWRGIIDYRLVHRTDNSAMLVDYKTGKPHQKWVQLGMFAIHTFAAFPKVNLINAQFYWTKTMETTKKVWSRADIESIWALFTGDLRQYRDAWKNDIWQERPSGLCRGWCPVKTCQHWQPKRER